MTENEKYVNKIVERVGVHWLRDMAREIVADLPTGESVRIEIPAPVGAEREKIALEVLKEINDDIHEENVSGDTLQIDCIFDAIKNRIQSRIDKAKGNI